MKKLNTKLTIPKLRTICKYQENSSTVKNTADTDPTTGTGVTATGIIGVGW